MEEYTTLNNYSAPAKESICGIWNWIKMTVPIIMWNNMWLSAGSCLRHGQSLYTEVFCFMEILKHMKSIKMNKRLQLDLLFRGRLYVKTTGLNERWKIKMACFKALVWKMQQLCLVLWPVLQWMVTFDWLLTVKGNLTQLCWRLKGQLSLSDILFFSKRAVITACGSSQGLLGVCP